MESKMQLESGVYLGLSHAFMMQHFWENFGKKVPFDRLLSPSLKSFDNQSKISDNEKISQFRYLMYLQYSKQWKWKVGVQR